MVLLREFLSLLRAENVRFDSAMSQVPLLKVFFGTDVSHHPNFCLEWLRFPFPPCSAAYSTCVSRVSAEISNVLTLDLSDQKICFSVLLPAEGSSAQVYFVYFQGES